MARTCPSCGAHISKGSDRCELCGTPADLSREELESERGGAVPDSGDAEAPTSDAPRETAHDVPSGKSPSTQPRPTQPPSTQPQSSTPDTGVFCNQCGWKNPPGARYCSQCGAKLQSFEESTASDVSGAASPAVREKEGAPTVPPGPREAPASESPDEHEKGLGRQVVIIVGAGLLFVFALYMITQLSGQSNQVELQPAESPAVTVEEEPLAEQFRPRESELRDQLEGLEGEESLETRRRLLDLYLAANRFGLAGEAAEEIARITMTENDWAIAGNLYYDEMERRTGAGRTAYALKAIDAYKQALQINPENLDVRTDMAIAYMYDPNNPMMAIQETNRVLELDSTHVQANFNRGVMLANINRIDQAIDQFERVKRIIGDPESPIYQRAEEAIESVQGAAGAGQ